MRLSVTDYAKQLGITRQAVLLQIKEKRLPKNVTVAIGEVKADHN